MHGHVRITGQFRRRRVADSKFRSEDADIAGRRSPLFYVFMAIFVAIGLFALGFMIFNLDRGEGNFQVHEATDTTPAAPQPVPQPGDPQPPPAPG